ncbi:MAG TPA: LuxR C-terminal-related transcriptional regulator [Streptosporangiaceae bacterium]|nr:LuxR C-terminal-related transcriptional regulator [Streptosporangiaceae bacterium]
MLGLPPLLEDKLRVPRLTLAVLRRRRLTELIDAAARHRVTVVSGPAGAGKTVACAAWAVARPAGRQPAWLTIDAEDRDPARFWQYVLAALVRAGAVGPEDAGQLAAAPPEAYPLQIVAATRNLPDPVVLMLDDVHELAGCGPVLTGLNTLIKHAPAGLRLVLSGRCPPELSLARLRVAGELTDISAADLACTAAEADAYFSMLGLGMPAARRAELLRRTEGWMAGLRLAVMTPRPGAPRGSRPGGPAATGAEGDPESPPEPATTGRGTAGAEGAVIDYVRDEVLARQSPASREFMLRTSVTTSLTGGLADALTGQDGTGARTLERLSRETGLVDPVGAGQDGYRYHPMLREVLAAELRRELPHEVPGLLNRAARWHADRGHAVEAVRLAADAGDWDQGARVLAEAGAGVLTADRLVSGGSGPGIAALSDTAPDGPAGLEAVLAAFPADRRAGDAPVAAALAAARLWQDDPDGAAPHLACAERSLPRLEDDARQVIEPWLTALRVMQGACDAAADPDWLARQQARAEQAEATAAAVPQYRAAGLLWFALGCARLRRLEVIAARHAFGRASAQLTAGSMPGLRARALAWQALAAARQGSLAAASAMLAETAADPAEIAGPDSADPALDCPRALATAQVSLARDEVDAARALLDEADRCAGAGQIAGEPPAALISGLIRVHCAMAESDPAAARSVLARLRETIEPGEPAIGSALTLAEASAALAAGEPELAALALDGGSDDPGRFPAASALIRGRLALAAGDDQGALELIGPVLAEPGPDTTIPDDVVPAAVGTAAAGPAAAVPAGVMPADVVPAGVGTADVVLDATLRDRIGALLVAAVARRRLGQVTEAGQAIEHALALAEPEGASRIFLDGGPAVRSAMTVLIPPTSRCAGFAGRILERFDAQLPRPAAAAPGSPADLPLTSSELAVLRFLPSHMTNQEIAEALFLSINTVKTHLRSAYRKLGVANRRQAIARGRRLDLL